MTITQTVEIPADRRITLEIPREIPTGTKARFELTCLSRRLHRSCNRNQIGR